MRRDRLERVLVTFVFAWLFWRSFRLIQDGWGYTADDAYITLRYARHLAEGHGIVWNVGEAIPVEGYSNFLFVLLGAAALALGVDPVLTLKAVSCVALAPTCVLLYVLARRWLPPLLSALPALLLLTFDGEIFWAISGLETGVYQLFVVGATCTFVLGLDAPCASSEAAWWSRPRLHLVAGGLCFLAGLARPEGPLVGVVLGVTALLELASSWIRAKRAHDVTGRAEAWRALKLTVQAFTLSFALPYALYFGWRLVHFQRLLPNTVYCKAAFKDDSSSLVHDFWQAGKIFILLALFQNPRKLDARFVPLLLLPVAYVGILLRADPIIGHHCRHFLAALALLMVASSLGVANLVALAWSTLRWLGRPLARRWPRLTAFSGASAAALLTAEAALMLFGLVELAPSTPTTGSFSLRPPGSRVPITYERRMREREKLGHYLDDTLRSDQSYLIGDAGMVPYVSRANVVDSFCLNSREMTSAPISFDRARYLDWVFARSPDVLVIHSSSPRTLSPRGEYDFFPSLVRDPRFRANYQQRKAPIFGARGDDFFYWIFERREPVTTRS